MTANLPKIKIFTALSLASLLAISYSVKAFGQTTSETASSVGIQVSAPSYSFNIAPGGSAQEIIKIRNVGNTKQTFYPEVLDFRPAGETGAPTFITQKDSQTYTYSLASWITISTNPITLNPEESTALNFTISVPKNAEPGGRYAGILFGTSPPKPEAGQVAIANKVGSLILVRVLGDAKETASIKEFSTSKTTYKSGPIDFTVRVENSGNVHVVPKGTITIKGIFGNTVRIINVNENGGNVLPGSVRKFDKENGLSWNPQGFTFGRYNAELLLTYGSPAKTLAAQTTFWIIPWTQLAMFSLVAIVALLAIIFGIKKYNQFIINKALKEKSNQ